VRNLNSAARSSKGTHLWFCKIIVNKLSKRKKKKKKKNEKKKKKKKKERKKKKRKEKKKSALQPLFESLFILTDISAD